MSVGSAPPSEAWPSAVPWAPARSMIVRCSRHPYLATVMPRDIGVTYFTQDWLRWLTRQINCGPINKWREAVCIPYAYEHGEDWRIPTTPPLAGRMIGKSCRGAAIVSLFHVYDGVAPVVVAAGKRLNRFWMA
jgi:hypothetical protein